MTPSQRSLASSCRSEWAHSPSIGRHATRAARRSCPSRKMSAETLTLSPVTALAGNPAGVEGRTASITTFPVTGIHLAYHVRARRETWNGGPGHGREHGRGTDGNADRDARREMVGAAGALV